MLTAKSIHAQIVSGFLALFPFLPVLASAQSDAAASTGAGGSVLPGGTIPAGTRIKLDNWQKYRQIMPDEMIALFQRRYYWKMPPDAEMVVGPVVIHPLPKTYLDATEKYASQVTLVELPGGRLSMNGYQGGTPFPNPA
jgi:hypothetical protein